MAGRCRCCPSCSQVVLVGHSRDRVVVVDVGVGMVVVQGRLGSPPDRYLGWFQATGRRLVVVVMVVMAEMARSTGQQRRETRKGPGLTECADVDVGVDGGGGGGASSCPSWTSLRRPLGLASDPCLRASSG